MRVLAGLLLALLPAIAGAAVPVSSARIVASYPHDPGAFTEGLFWRGGRFYESTGMPGASSIREVEPATGRVLRRVDLPAPLFGEGIAPVGREIVSLTWRGGVGFRWSLAGFRKLGSWRYPGEGWALTSDGRNLVMSDGTPELRLLDPKTLRERRRITVTADGVPVANLNELEYVDHEILANIWMSDRIARIDPASGKVVGWIDVAALRAKAGVSNRDAVANGIAWDRTRRRLFVTGKYWPRLFEIAPPKGR